MDDPAAWMLACHERIRRFTTGLGRLAALEDPADPRAAEAAATCARYYREGLPLHAADEDASIAPRLRGTAGPVLDDALRRMHEEHLEAEPHLAAVLALLDPVAAGAPVDRAALAPEAAWLDAHFAAHLAAEETIVVPALAGVPADVRAAILAEMRARRA